MCVRDSNSALGSDPSQQDLVCGCTEPLSYFIDWFVHRSSGLVRNWAISCIRTELGGLIDEARIRQR